MGFILFPKEAGAPGISPSQLWGTFWWTKLLFHIFLFSKFHQATWDLRHTWIIPHWGQKSVPSGATLGKFCQRYYSSMGLFFGAAHWVSHNHTQSSELHFSLCLFLRTHTTSSLIVSYLQITTSTVLWTLTVSSSSNCYPLHRDK